jgi:hypothetical protein
MIAVLIILALVLIAWWAVWTVKVFASIARDLWRAALGVGTIVGILYRHFQRPPDLLADFLDRRRAARH